MWLVQTIGKLKFILINFIPAIKNPNQSIFVLYQYFSTISQVRANAKFKAISRKQDDIK